MNATPSDSADRPAHGFTHLDTEGRAKMVDVSPKAETARRARAAARVLMLPETWQRLCKGEVAKGDAFAVARVAGIQGAKQTSALIPLCHPLRITKVHVSFDKQTEGEIGIEAEVHAVDRTGVEMEALTAAAVAGLALYDMIKGVDRSARLEDVKLLEKVGGKTGHWMREGSDA